MSLFVTFEGPDGSGKTTQARILYESLQARNYPVILTREPGGTRIGELIRRILLDLQHTEIEATTEMLLFSAARAQLVSEIIRPYLTTGGIVVCDRYADSTYAYQGYGLRRDLDELATLTTIATGGLVPDLTFYLDISVEQGLERKRTAKRAERPARGNEVLLPPGSGGSGGSGSPPPEWNRLDARDMAYHQRVAEGFQTLMAANPERWRRLDAHLPVDVLAQEVLTSVEPWLARVRPLER